MLDMEAVMIKLRNAGLEYKNFCLGPINLELKLGEFISVVGPSGSGKSTLIKVITGHNMLTSGEIEYIDCTSDDIMYISQIGTTFNHLTVKDNLKLKYDYSNKEITDSLQLVGLSSDFIDKYPFELSGGERQRIDLVRALLSKSKYIVLDESMSALDGANKQAISELLKQLVSSGRITIIYITHDVAQAIEHSTRIININKGKMLFDGSATEFKAFKAGE